MNEAVSKEIKRLEQAFDRIERDTPFLKAIVNAFKGIMVSRVMLKAKLSDRPDVHISPPERLRLSEGFPWLTKETIIAFMDPWGEPVESTMPPLAKAFPSITTEVQKLRDAFGTGRADLKQCIEALIEGKENDLAQIAASLGFSPAVLKFILGLMLKPFVEKRTESLRSLIKDLPWHQGYCPICGSFPEMSFLAGEGGQRWLKCSLCGYDWRFDRMLCPSCQKKSENKEFVSVEGAEHKWMELCPDCHRYIVGIDLRKQTGITAEVAAIGMAHLDLMAQKKGFVPIAECAWNTWDVVPPEYIDEQGQPHTIN